MHDSTPAAAIQAAVTESVQAAVDRDSDRFRAGAAALAKLDQAQLTIVQATVIRVLLELRHPDGLTGAEIKQLLSETAEHSAEWWPDADAQALVAVLLNSLSVADPAQPTAFEGPAHASLLIAELVAGQPAALAAHLAGALAEVRRAETMEMP
jgi:hypothetical protein